jgi:two-component system response regulator HydG
LTSLQKILQPEGLGVLTAENAKLALELLRRHRVQVVLSDLMMPGTRGEADSA